MQNEAILTQIMVPVAISKAGKTGKRSTKLLQPHHWPPNNPDLNTVDFEIWGVVEQNVYQG